jgi:hypothetical protein
VILLASLARFDWTQALFLRATYYLHLALVLIWAGLYLGRVRHMNRERMASWARDNTPGLALALSVTLLIGVSVEPALRVLSDEANLVGISKNLYSLQSPTFTLSGKNYYGAYWDVAVVIDQRPTIFPFFVSLVHAVLGYTFENVFRLNLMILPLFLLVVYRLAKSLGGEAFGLVAAVFSVAHPVVMICVRSGGFDFFAAFFSVLTLKSLLDFLRRKGAEDFALLWLNLCLFAGIRYESALFLVPLLGLVAAQNLITKALLRPYALLYAVSPALLLPRLWLSLLRGNVPKQETGAAALSLENFLNNVHEYFLPLVDPFGSYPAHSAFLIALGLLGCAYWLWLRPDRVKGAERISDESRFALITVAWMLTQVVIVFAYAWGRAQYPSAARLVAPIDVFFSLMAAWFVVRLLSLRGRQNALLSVLFAGGVLVTQVPTAARAKMMSKLTETRENAEVWRFFRRLGEEQILIVSGRPIHFTIMNYGSMTFESARNDPYLFTALDRRLFQEVFLIQHIRLSTGLPLPGYEFWSDRHLQTVHEFQNEDNVLVRISKVTRQPLVQSSD